MKNPTILFTGGHPTPAIAVIEEIRKTHPSWNIVWVGRSHTFEGKKEHSPEYMLIRSMDIPFINLTTGRLQRSLSWYTLPSLLKFPYGFVRSITLLRTYRPSVVVSFGGYIALPVSCAAYLMRIPVVTHEQVHKPGISNSLIACIAQKICVSYEDTLDWVPKEKSVVTGLPVRSGIFTPSVNPSFTIPKDKLPILYITGGSTGAESLNNKLFPIIPKLLNNYIIIHQTGGLSHAASEDMRMHLGLLKSRYISRPFFLTTDLSWIYHHVDGIIGRSGANTIGELLYFHIPAVFVPLPWSGGGEQKKNAQFYLVHEKGIIVDQDAISEESLVHAVQTFVHTSRVRRGNRFASLIHATGAENIVREIQRVLSSYESR